MVSSQIPKSLIQDSPKKILFLVWPD